jgi:hypothetical protein
VNRRRFLLFSAAAIAGCGRKASQSTPVDFDTIAAERRQQFLAERIAYRVERTATFTTPKPSVNVPDVVPELKALSKVTIRLHPRFSEEPKPSESKLGGTFLWPADEPWPIHSQSKLPYQPILQLRSDDAPPNFAYLPGTDLLQLLWLPQKELLPIIAWRKEATVKQTLGPLPNLANGSIDYVPEPCRVFPERVMEYPGIELLPESVRSKIKDPTAYDKTLSVAVGTKVGGYPRGLKPGDDTSCPSCRKVTDFLLTIDQSEWTDDSKSRWMPGEEQGKKAIPNHTGLYFGPSFGRVHLFICRRCEGWPIRHIIQAG